MKKTAVLFSFLLLLVGCAKNQPTAQSIREHFDALPAFSAHVKIFSDFGGSALEYELDYAYNRKGSDHLTLTAPEAVSGIEATIDGEDSFPYYQYPSFSSQEEQEGYLTEVLARSLYDTGVRPAWGDRVATLSTCSYVGDAGRFVVVAVEKNRQKRKNRT